jgi:hypothetical protein
MLLRMNRGFFGKMGVGPPNGPLHIIRDPVPPRDVFQKSSQLYRSDLDGRSMSLALPSVKGVKYVRFD